MLFQFHKGTIKTPKADQTHLSWAEFQFHKGTIKTAPRNTGLLFDVSFQFHKGTIKTMRLQQVGTEYDYFNSIKVRLKLMTASWNLMFIIFQFHKGTIKTSNTMSTDDYTTLFQFHKGTIKTWILCIMIPSLSVISIP